MKCGKTVFMFLLVLVLPLLLALPSYFITEIKHASFQDYITGKDALIRVGDSYFTSLLKVDDYEPSTALDVSYSTTMGISLVFGAEDYTSQNKKLTPTI